MSVPALFLKASLMHAFTSVCPEIFGSWMKAWPLLEFGGRSPVVAYLRHSMVVVFPQPLGPMITVRGL
jgi:hypothetical protein